ncbi:MAG: hypothetical protein ACXABY_17435 [Candidatus Thorarchaeota archaeon]|jgi:hypothetical protein
MSNESRIGRKQSFRALIPTNLKEDSDRDLRLILVSLRNAESAIAVYIQKIEKELTKRGSRTQILGYKRD